MGMHRIKPLLGLFLLLNLLQISFNCDVIASHYRNRVAAMIKIISPRHRIESESYSLFFPCLDYPGAGWAPPCDKDGNVSAERLAEVEQHRADPNYGAPYVQTYRHSYMEPAIARCYCGTEIALSDPMDNDCRKCGRIYNSSGQEVRCHAREADEPYEEDF
jgi:hypothetical protein